MSCHHFAAGRCASCSLLPSPYDAQLATKVDQVTALLPPVAWSSPVRSAEWGFRNKAKMVVTGTADTPALGILAPAGVGVDLRDCPLYSHPMQASLEVLGSFVARARLTPYDIGARRGELKHLLVTESPDGELMVRFVLRSTEAESRIRKHLTWLLDALPVTRVVSLNIQPEHKAVLEGEREIVLHGSTLPMRVNDLTLHLRPASFFQTNTAVAAVLYARAREWASAALGAEPVEILDLYCGVGGFALHLAGPGRVVTGVEVSPEAVASAQRSAREAGLVGARFVAGDATVAPFDDRAPDLVVVNPPRRGIGPDLAGRLERSRVRHVLYSSCRAETLARDLASMPSLQPVRGVLLDMFPHASHYEVLLHLERR